MQVSCEVNLTEIASISILDAIPDDLLTKALATPPFIPLDGSLNFRDLGLLPHSPIKQGLIYRSGSLHSTSPTALSSLGIKKIFDLRQEREIKQFPTPEIPGVQVLWCPSSSTPQQTNPADFVENEGVNGFIKMYKHVLDIYGESFKKILEFLRDDPNSPIVFHCAAGKDRTGMLAALLLSIAGMGKETIAYDYSLTRIGVERDRILLTENLKKWLGDDAMDKPGVFELSSNNKGTMLSFLDFVEKEYDGGFEGYLVKELGLGKGDLERIVKNISVEEQK